MKITKSQLKQIIQEELQQVLSEKTLFSTLIDLLGKDHSARYKGKKGKEAADFERLLKQMWNAEVDRSFIESVKLVHWLMFPPLQIGRAHV